MLCVIGCGGSGGRVNAFPPGSEVSGSAALIDATHRGDAAAVQRLLRAPIGYGGLVFHNADCNQRFATAGTIQAADVPAFAVCLATLPLAASRHRRHELPDTALLVYDPGIEIEARFEDRGDSQPLRWIGFVGRESLADALPTVQPDVLADRTISAAPVLPVVKARFDAERAARKLAVIDSWFKLCIDTAGHVTSLRAREVTSPALAQLVANVLATWTFRPFEFDGTPIAVCSLVGFHYPHPKVMTEMLPLPPPPDTPASVVVARSSLVRVAGDQNIIPDDDDRIRLGQAHIDRITAALVYCLDETGRVTTDYVARSSGLPRYDELLASAVKNWRFQPFLTDGAAIPVCSTAIFAYTQRPGQLVAPRRTCFMRSCTR